MKPITIRIADAVSDAYFYMGKLFILSEDRRLKVITHQRLFQKYLAGNQLQHGNFLHQALFSNELFPSRQDYFKDTNYKNNLDNFWRSASQQSTEIEIDQADLTTICHLPEQEALDFVIYAQRAFVGNRSGLFECQLSVDGDTVSAGNNQFTRVLDSKTINLNPRVGRLLVSTKDDGLFAGAITTPTERTVIPDRAIESRSLRTGWANYNFVNYTSSTEADYFVNKTEEDKSPEGANFKVDDGGSKSLKITEMGSAKKSISDAIENATKKDKIIYAFNSLNFSFGITKSGSILHSKFREEIKSNESALTEFQEFKDLSFDIEKLGHPLSGHTVAGGTLLEFYDKVMLMKGGKIQEVSDMQCTQIRTFASSKWFKNIALTVSEEYFEIHSIHPFK